MASFIANTEEALASKVAALSPEVLGLLAADSLGVRVRTVNFDAVPGYRNIAALWQTGHQASDGVASDGIVSDGIIYLDYRIPVRQVMGSLLHEVAHCLAYRSGYEGHCAEWRGICEAIGGNPGKARIGRRRTLQRHISFSLMVGRDAAGIYVATDAFRLRAA